MRRQKELQRERAAINIELAGFSSKLTNLAAMLITDKSHAYGILKEIDTAKIAVLIDDFLRVDTASAQCGRNIAALDI